jgi:tRNA pseudouridine55 synthase
MDGILLIDKPSGMTSHDVVAWARRRLGQRGIGHAGTLDPMATGLLVLMVGKATRLASLLTGKDKTYEATLRLGFETDTDDADGTPVGGRVADLPADSRIQETLGTFLGTFPQVPPAHSAKRVAGTRAYTLARQDKPVQLSPVEVTTRRLDWQGRDGDLVRFHVTASAGFYVRALARDVGRRLGCGAHLSALRRVRSGSFTI